LRILTAAKFPRATLRETLRKEISADGKSEVSKDHKAEGEHEKAVD